MDGEYIVKHLGAKLDQLIASGSGGSGSGSSGGVKGDKGDPGKSAYQIWLELGNSGSEQDFINSLKGPKGDAGEKGADGTGGSGSATPLPFKQIMTGETLISAMTVVSGTGNNTVYQVNFPEPFADGDIPQVMIQSSGDNAARLEYYREVTNTGFLYSSAYDNKTRKIKWTAFTLNLDLFNNGVYPKQ